MTESLARTLHDIARVLESVAESEARELRVLELLQRIVPNEQCAVLHVPPGRKPRLLVVPATQPAETDTLMKTLAGLHSLLVDERTLSPGEQPRRWETYLAIPLIGDDQVIGVLLVSGAVSGASPGGYTEQHLRDLSIVGAQLAGYLVTVDQARRFDEARREAEAANRMKDVFLALVSRALKAPLISTLAWARVINSENVAPSERSRAVEAIERNAIVQGKRVDELLELSCVMAADPHLDLESVAPASLIAAAVEEQRPRAERRSVRVETVLDGSVRRLVVDRARIVRVISNLLANAIQFTASGGRVEVHLAEGGEHAWIQVIDYGRGIMPEDLPNLFETFRPSKNHLTRTYGELGGGLAIVRPLVEAHGGRVCADSSGDQQGSTFTIALPLQGEALEIRERPLAGVRVLLVDDDGEMLLATRMLLEHFGAEVTAVGSVGAALEALERSRPDVLVSDLMMRGESGYDLIREVAARDPKLPAAALTASGAHDERGRALAAGFRTYLAKPFGTLSLVSAVAALAGRPLRAGSAAAMTAE